jgi:hypothetical protein
MRFPNPPRWLRRIVIALTIRRLLRSGVRDRLRASEPTPREHGTVLTLADLASGYLSMEHAVPVASRPAKRAPGRQTIRMPQSVHSVFGGSAWSLTPPGAHEAPWEDCHTFPKGGRPTRDAAGLNGEPAIAFVCPGCELAQPPMQEERRACGYCGLNIRRHGTRLYWWRTEIEVQEWKP